MIRSFFVLVILIFAVVFAQSYQEAAHFYSQGKWSQAQEVLNKLLEKEPDNNDAKIKLAFTLIQLDQALEAETLFLNVLKSLAPEQSEDVYFGLALANRKLADYEDAYRYIDLAIAIGSSPAQYIQVKNSLPPEREPLAAYQKTILPEMPFIASDAYLRYANGQKIIVKGVNMGLALPGKFPAEFPTDKALYLEWFKLISEMNANVIRLYTIVPPVFYEALLEHNLAHPNKKLLILHGVWTELPEGHNYRADFEQGFFAEAKRVIDVLHGNARIAKKAGHAFGSYDADVSPYLLGLIIGREWEPFSVKEYNMLEPVNTYSGKYLYCSDCNPMEAWLSSFMDKIIDYQMQSYNQQSPIAFTNWPTLDPLSHITESTRAEEDEIRQKIGEPVSKRPTLEYNNDESSIDSTKILPTALYKAGHFASYHAYPYYPDFMNLDEDYKKHQVSAYQAYLEDLKAYHGLQPVIISEFGVPSSKGRAHIHPNGYHHGGHSEYSQAKVDVELFEQIVNAGLGGGVIFAWLDEWFKRNWIFLDIEIPQERLPYWHSVMNAEENYGIMRAFADGPRLRNFQDDIVNAQQLLRTQDLQIFALADATYLHIFLRNDNDIENLELYIDTHPDAKDEFKIVLNRVFGFIYIDQGYQFFKALDQGQAWELFRFDEKAYPNASGWEAWMTEPNRRRFSRNGSIYPRKTENAGILIAGKEYGNYFNSRLDYYFEDNNLHLRLPWPLLGIGDPSQKIIYDGSSDNLTRQINDIGIKIKLSEQEYKARFSWDNWQEPSYNLGLKPLYYYLQKAWR